jgi:hypothetical protein
LSDNEENDENDTDDKIQISIMPNVQKRLDSIKVLYDDDNGFTIKTDGGAIRYALKRAKLWNIP